MVAIEAVVRVVVTRGAGSVHAAMVRDGKGAARRGRAVAVRVDVEVRGVGVRGARRELVEVVGLGVGRGDVHRELEAVSCRVVHLVGTLRERDEVVRGAHRELVGGGVRDRAEHLE